MKHKILPIIALLFSPYIFAQETAPTLESQNKMKGGEVYWQDTNAWQNQNVDLPPNSNLSYIANEWNSNKIYVTGDYTVGKIASNSDSGYSNNGVFIYDMSVSENNNTLGSITIDSAYNTSAAIDCTLNGRSKPEIYNQNILFQGGTVNLTDTLTANRQVDLFLNCWIDPKEEPQTNYTKAITFSGDTTLNVDRNIRIGTNSNGTQFRKQEFNFLGFTNVFEDVGGDLPNFKSVLFHTANSASEFTNLVVNIGNSENLTAEFTSGKVTQAANIDVNIAGKMNVYGNYTVQSGTGKFSSINVASTGSLILNSPTTEDVRFQATNANIRVDGVMQINHTGISSNADVFNNTTFVVGSTGSVTIGSTDGNKADISMSLGDNTTLIVEKGGFLSVSKQVRIWGDNVRVVVNQENGISSKEYGNKWKIIVGNVTTQKNTFLEFNANQDLAGISFWGDKTSMNEYTLHIKIGDQVTRLAFDKLMLDGGTLANNRIIEFENFANDTIFFANKDDTAILENIITKEGDFIDFYWQETTGGWYLNAIQVPEPATVAAIIGALALGFVAYRKRK